MKKYNLIALSTLLLLAGAASGLRAAVPENGTIILPEISKELAGIVTQIDFEVTLKDNPGKPALARWKDGGWRDLKRNAAARLLFPLKGLANPQDPELRYQMSYEVTYLTGTARLRVKELLPIGAASGFSVAPTLPFDPVYIDAGKLEFATQARDRGLFKVDWAISRKMKGQTWKTTGNLSAKEAFGGLVVNKEEELRANITFICMANRKVTKVPWADNAKDLRKLPSGLSIVLTQPVCPR